MDGSIDAEDDGICIAKKSCKDSDQSKTMDAKLTKCSHCGAKDWNILGDAESGYILSQNDSTTCLVREKNSRKALTAPCNSQDTPFSPLQLQFASPSDIEAMSQPGARLVGAANDGDIKAIQQLLKDGTDVMERDWDDLTALIPAASNGHLDICKLLVQKGIEVDATDKDGITALMEASIMGHTKVVEFLLENGAEVDATASSGVSALWLAASEGKTDVMKALLRKGADAKSTRVDGISALMTASASGHIDAAKLLLENGADPNATDKDGTTPLMNAAESGNVDLIKLLVEKAEDPVQYVNTVSAAGFNAIIMASAHGKAEAVDYLIGAGAALGPVGENGVTPLMYAAASDHLDVVKLLVEKGNAELEALHYNKGTALTESCSAGAADVIAYLLEAGANVESRDDDNVTPLMAIASQGNFEGQKHVINKLKEKLSADQLTEHINLFSFSGGSAVMFAAAGGHLESMKQLMELGADVHAIARATPDYLVKLKAMIESGEVTEDDPHVDGVTALHVAAQGGHLDCVKTLIEAGVKVDVEDDEKRTALTMAIKGNHGDCASELVRGGADPNTPYTDDEGEEHNLLFDAIMVENVAFSTLLIEKGADIYFTDDKGVSTLLQASHRGLTEVVSALLKANEGQNKPNFVNAPSEEGVTPLIAAASEGFPEVVKLLLAAGANVDAKDNDQTTALMASSARGHVPVVDALLEAGAKINEQNVDGHTALMFAYNGKNQVQTLWERYIEYKSENAADDSAEDGGTGDIIQEAMSNHTALVDKLLKSGADPSIKDKEGHTAKDFDFSKEADAGLRSGVKEASTGNGAGDSSKEEL